MNRKRLADIGSILSMSGCLMYLQCEYGIGLLAYVLICCVGIVWAIDGAINTIE